MHTICHPAPESPRAGESQERESQERESQEIEMRRLYTFPASATRLCAIQTWADPNIRRALNLKCTNIWGDLKPVVMWNLNCPKIWGEVKCHWHAVHLKLERNT